MINPPLKHVLTLVCLAETGSFRRAAERLRLSQPAVSAHIREIERHFGVALVHRTTRQVSFTAEGQAFVARARRALQELDLATQDLHDLAAVHRGSVVVACIPPLMSHLIPTILRRIAQSHPAVEVTILDVMSAQVEQLVSHGEADFGIGPRPSSAVLAFTKMEQDDFVVAVPQGHPLAGAEAVGLEDIAAYPFIAVSRDANARQIIDRALLRLRRPITPRFELVHHFSVGRLIEAGLGVSVLPRSAVPSLASDRIVTVNLRSKRVYRDIGLIVRRNYQPSPSAQAFLSLLEQETAATRSRKPRSGAPQKRKRSAGNAR